MFEVIRNIIKNYKYYLLSRKKWKKYWNIESDDSKWEIWNDIENKQITLHYVPKEDYSPSDIKIKMSYEEFNDLNKVLTRYV